MSILLKISDFDILEVDSIIKLESKKSNVTEYDNEFFKILENRVGPKESVIKLQHIDKQTNKLDYIVDLSRRQLKLNYTMRFIIT